MNKTEDCIRRAQDCERQAAGIDDIQHRALLLDKAAEWRDEARRVVDLATFDRLFARQGDKAEAIPIGVGRR